MGKTHIIISIFLYANPFKQRSFMTTIKTYPQFVRSTFILKKKCRNSWKKKLIPSAMNIISL